MSYHREVEYALERAESAVSAAQQALTCLPDNDNDVETEVGEIFDKLRDIHSDASELLTTDLEDAVDSISRIVDRLSDLCTEVSDLYNRL